MSDIAAIRAAAARAEGHIRRTPLLEAPSLSAIAGRRVLVKAECLQVTGSFKARGGWAAISALTPDDARRGVLAMSSGNHAQGVAWAAAAHGVPAVILMPADAPASKIAGTRGHGAEVVTYDRATEDRDALAATLAAERGLTLIPPFDHPEVIAGQGTTGLEIAGQARAAGVTEADVLVCTGGGGLSAGIALALAAEAPGLRVRTVEPVGFDDVARSLASGTRQRNPAATGSICDAILTPAPGMLTFPILGPCRTGSGCFRRRGACRSGAGVPPSQAGAGARRRGGTGRGAVPAGGLTGEAVIAVATGGNVEVGTYGRALARL